MTGMASVFCLLRAGRTTVFIGNYFEWTGTAASAVRYYYAGGTRIAMRQGSGSVTWLLGDHLGQHQRELRWDK